MKIDVTMDKLIVVFALLLSANVLWAQKIEIYNPDADAQKK